MAPAGGEHATAAEVCEALASEEVIAGLSFYGLCHWNEELRSLEGGLETAQQKAAKGGKLSSEEEELLGVATELGEAGKRLRRRMAELLEHPELTDVEKPLASEFLKSQIAKLTAEADADAKSQKRAEKLQALLASVETKQPVPDSKKMAKLKTELAKLEKEEKEVAPKYEQWEKGRFTFKSNDELQAFQRKHQELQKGLAAQRSAVEALRRLRGPEGSGSSPSAPDKKAAGAEEEEEEAAPQPQKRPSAALPSWKAAGSKGKKGAKGRKAGRGEREEPGEPEAAAAPSRPAAGATLDLLRGLVEGSCLVKASSNVQALSKAGPEAAAQAFTALHERLAWHNALGLAEPAGAAEAKEAWRGFWQRPADWGPRKSRRGTPGADRVMKNVQAYVPQYLHLLLVLMLVRSLGRWGLLAWCCGLQAAAVLVPLEVVPQVPAKSRAACALGAHGLLWLFFLLEALWRTYFFEKLFVVCLVAGHAYCVRPSED